MRAIGLLVTSFFLISSLGTARAAPLNIKVGWVFLTSSSVPLSLEKKDILKHYGKSYTIDPVRIRATPAMITALGTGDVNVGTLAFSSLAFAIQNAKLTDLRIISDVLEDGVDDHDTGHFMVLKNSGIRTVKDLKGKVIASLAMGGAVDIAMRAMLRKNGLDDATDVTIIEAAFPNMTAMLLEHKASLVIEERPFFDNPKLQAAARTLFTQKQAMGTTQMLVWVARAGFIKAHRAALVDFLEDSVRATRYFLNPAHHAEMVRRVARGMKVPQKAFNSWLFTKKDMYRDPNGLPNMRALQANIDTQRKLGFIKEKIRIADYADLSLVKEAVARLGKVKD